MDSSFNGILMLVKNRGEPSFWSGKREREILELKIFETRNADMFGRFLQILENKL